MLGVREYSKVRIAKWGNSTAVRLPKEVMSEAHMREGDELLMEVIAPGVVRLRTTEAILTLEDLLSETKPGIFEEIDWGTPRGKEAW